MGLFTRIFGKGDEESDKRVEKEIEQIKAGQINKIYPILKPGDWVGIKAGALKKTLVGTFEDPILVLGFGYDAPSNFVFLKYSDVRDKNVDKIVDEANENLENVQSDFAITETAKGQILTASGHDFSSEKILCKSHMLKAHEILKTDELLVSIPRRRCMMVIANNAEQELKDAFALLHKDAWEDDSFGNPPILNTFFLVINGEIDSILS